MRIKLFLSPLAFVLMLLSSQNGKAQKKEQMVSLIVGTWKGTSLCQVKNSPCHDEKVVYYITKADSVDRYIIQANKIVNNKEEEMGPLKVILNRKTNQLISTEYGNTWTFTIHGEKMPGSLVYRESLYRLIEVTKSK